MVAHRPMGTLQANGIQTNVRQLEVESLNVYLCSMLGTISRVYIH